MSDRAWAWRRHLREGGTTPWTRWTGEDAGRPAPLPGPYLPGAQQLELLRRLNHAGPPSGELAERVLAASAPGRGRPDLELVGAAPPRGFGPQPVDPADLPDAELLRVATSLLAEDLVAAGPGPVPRPGVERPWRRPYRLAGDPWQVVAVREELLRRGRPPGGRRPVTVLLGTDLATLLRHTHTARAFEVGGPPWHRWLRRLVSDDALPPRADLARVAARRARRAGPDRVRLVLDDAALPRALGVRRRLPAPPEPSAAGVDLARWVAAPLGLLVVPDERAALLRRTLLPRVLEADADGAPLAVPAHHHAWLAEHTERQRRAVAAADYPVLGSTDRLRPAAAPPGAGAPDDAAALALALRLLLAGGARGAGGAGGEGTP